MNTAATAAAPSRADIEARIVKRCWTDEAFRRDLLADPAACFVKYTGLPAEQAPAIVIHEESGSDWHIVIPAKPAQAGELSDADLERIAGGTDPLTTVVTAVTVTAVTTVLASVVTVGASASAAATYIGSAISFYTIKDTNW